MFPFPKQAQRHQLCLSPGGWRRGTCPANLQAKSIGGKIAQVRFHPWSLKNRSANATAPSGEGRGRDNGDKMRLRMESCLSRTGSLHNPASGQSHVPGTRGAWTRESQNAEGFPLLPCPPYSPTLPCSSWEAQHRVQSQRWRLRPQDKALNRIAQ